MKDDMQKLGLRVNSLKNWKNGREDIRWGIQEGKQPKDKEVQVRALSQSNDNGFSVCRVALLAYNEHL